MATVAFTAGASAHRLLFPSTVRMTLRTPFLPPMQPSDASDADATQRPERLLPPICSTSDQNPPPASRRMTLKSSSVRPYVRVSVDCPTSSLMAQRESASASSTRALFPAPIARAARSRRCTLGA